MDSEESERGGVCVCGVMVSFVLGEDWDEPSWRKERRALCHRVGCLPTVPCEPGLAPGSLKVGAGVRGKARLWRALKAVVTGRGLFLRAVGAMGGFKEAQLRRRRFRFVMWWARGRGKRETGEQEGGCLGCQETGTVTQSQQGR